MPQDHVRNNEADIREHPLRHALLHEVHARPFESLEGPLELSHFAMFSGTDSVDEELRHLTALATRVGVAPPREGSDHYVLQAPDFRMRWERHTEFSTYTIITDTVGGGTACALSKAPRRWLNELPGELLAACHLTIAREADGANEADMTDSFDPTSLAGSRVAGDAASVWTDFRVGVDGFTRLRVLDRGLQPSQAGRLVRRLLEVETYRVMALLGFPLARQVSPEMTGMESGLGDLMDQLAGVADLNTEREMLSELSELSARVERLMARTNFRFSATQAYGTLVKRRLMALRERRIEGVSTLSEFMDRRLAPALDTCEGTRERLDRLSKRLSRAANLLRTRVDVALEAQNRDLLDSMNRRARLQLRLQETVEGLSVVIISYYAIGLINYGLKGAKAGGMGLPVELLTGLSIPVVVAGVAYSLHRIRSRVRRAEPD